MQKFLSQLSACLSGILITALLATTIGLFPINQKGEVQKAEALFGAGDTVFVAGGFGTLQESISAAANGLIAKTQADDWLKEWVLDGILNGLAKMVLKSMTQSILTWINSGFEGKPAFVTDLKQFMRDRADTIVGDFIYNDEDLNFLCSPFQLDVKIALAVAYQEQAHEGLQAQCTLSDITDNVEGFLNGSFNEGGWDSWFTVTQNPVNTPTGAYLAAEGEMYARIADDQGRTVQELAWGKGFLSFKVCSDSDESITTGTDCDITTPGTVIANQINTSLGAGQDALIEADEINEIIGALFAQLAQQAVTGVYGLLGLGASSYSTSINGSPSYLDALGAESTLADGISNPFTEAIILEEENILLQEELIADIDATEVYLETKKLATSSCVNLNMPKELIDERDTAVLTIALKQGNTALLQELDTQYKKTNDPRKQLQIVETYNDLVSNGELTTEIANTLLRYYIDYDIADMISTFKSRIDAQIRSCEDD